MKKKFFYFFAEGSILFILFFFFLKHFGIKEINSQYLKIPSLSPMVYVIIISCLLIISRKFIRKTRLTVEKNNPESNSTLITLLLNVTMIMNTSLFTREMDIFSRVKEEHNCSELFTVPDFYLGFLLLMAIYCFLTFIIFLMVNVVKKI